MLIKRFQTFLEVRRGEALGGEAGGLSGADAGSAGAVMGKHALLSASSSKRWLSCTPSARLEEQFQEEHGGSVYAEEGTAAHALAEHKLKKALKRRSKRPVSDYHCDEMEECTDGYVAFAMEQVELARQECSDPVVLSAWR